MIDLYPIWWIFLGFTCGGIFALSSQEYSESQYQTFLKTKKLWDEFEETVK